MKKYKTELQQIMDIYGEKLAKLKGREEQNAAMYRGDMLRDSLVPIESERKKLKNETRELIKMLTQQARERIGAAQIDAADVDAATLALLDSSRIKLTQSEFDAVASRYEDNFTMNAALRTYANECDLKYNGIAPKWDALHMVDNIGKAAEMATYGEAAGYGHNVEASAALGGGVAI